MSINVPKLNYANIKDQIVNIIRSYILRGLLKPGEKLDLDELASQFGCSKTPVREAMQVLEHQGLVEIMPRKGTIVRMLDRQQRQENYELNEILYGEAAYLTCLRYQDPEEIRRLKETEDRLYDLACSGQEIPGALSRASVEYYQFLENNCGNSALVDAIHRYSINEIMSVFLDEEAVSESGVAKDITAMSADSQVSYHRLAKLGSDGVQNPFKLERRDRTYQYHVDTYDALLARDAEKAREIVIAYMKYKNEYFEKYAIGQTEN